MKAIILNTAETDNGGNRREAGETVAVGVKGDQIGRGRADDMVALRLAVAADAAASEPEAAAA